MSEDYYSTLEVDKNASQDDIKRAYRRLAMKYHPDRNNGDKAAEEKFKQVGTAYEVLGNEEKRRIYDQVGHQAYTQQGGAPGGPGGIHFDFSDIFSNLSGDSDDGTGFGGIFSDFFGGGRRSSRRSRNPNAPSRGDDIEFKERITFQTAFFGGDVEINFQLDDTCPHCKGAGGEPGSTRKTCPRCNGRGSIISANGIFQMQTTCPNCHGTGTVVSAVCSRCHGAGTIKVPRHLTLHVPAGVDTGSRLRSAGNGITGRNGGPNGDLYVTLIVGTHPIFKREGTELYCEVPIPFTTAALGGKIDVPTMDGKTSITIPQGTQNGTVFKIRGKGVPSLTRRDTQGSEHVKVTIEVPVNLNASQKASLNKFAETCGKENHPKWRSFWESVKRCFSNK